MMATSSVTLELTEEQKETIKALFAHYNWEYVEQNSERKDIEHNVSGCGEEAVNNEREDGNDPEQPDVQVQEGECLHCFQAPCLTLRRFQWIGTGQLACAENSAIRRTKYAHYWKVMAHIGGWNDPRYLQVKLARANGGEWAIKHRREVMPLCVLQQIRSLYPNPKDMPYMDHKWE